MKITTQRVDFEGSQGAKLSARLDLPTGFIKAYAIFAHCFTCSKDLHATKQISGVLSQNGIAVLRFDFTGLGNSDGDFSSTNFSSNVEDLVIAANYMRDHFEAPSLLIGHSLGGAAVLSAASEIPEVKAIATIGAPSEAEHVVHNFGVKIEEINEKGVADVSLAGRKFSIRKQFLDDLAQSNVIEKVKLLKKPLLVMHSPVDQTVGIENATKIFVAAKHPKSFVSLDNIDHLVSNDRDAHFIANQINTWAMRYVATDTPASEENTTNDLVVTETGEGKFQNIVAVGNHKMLSDEPKSVGGMDSGPTPYDYLAAALGTCTSMTLRMYSDFKKYDIGRISVTVKHKKIHAQDCQDCTSEEQSSGGKIDVFYRRIEVEGLQDKALEEKLLEIADKCPVHKTLEKGGKVETSIESAS